MNENLFMDKVNEISGLFNSMIGRDPGLVEISTDYCIYDWNSLKVKFSNSHVPTEFLITIYADYDKVLLGCLVYSVGDDLDKLLLTIVELLDDYEI